MPVRNMYFLYVANTACCGSISLIKKIIAARDGLTVDACQYKFFLIIIYKDEVFFN